MKRNDDLIISKLTEKGDQLLIKEDAKITFPSSYSDKGLYKIGDKTFVLGVFAIIIGNVYGVWVQPSMLEVNPQEAVEIDVDGVKYVELSFKKDSILIENLSTILSGITTIDSMFDMFILRGKQPWFMEPDDLYRVFDDAGTYSGVNIDGSMSVINLLLSTAVRSKKDLSIAHRITKPGTPHEFVGVANVNYGASSTSTKLIGNYQAEGMVGALITESEGVSPVEEILRA